MKYWNLEIAKIVGVLIPLSLPMCGNASTNTTLALTTRQRTLLPVAIPLGTPGLAPSNVSQYVTSGYASWNWGPGANEGRKFLAPLSDTGATNQARLLSFFSISDVHITDKESPGQVPYAGWKAAFLEGGPGGLNESAFSPVMFDTTHHLDSAVRTINALHRLTPFDFGMVLGDVCNSAQYNELRWFIDVMDGKYITPSSGANAGAATIDYQKPYQAAGLDRSIPWYEVIGNHDQFWMGIGYPTDKVKQAMVGSNILSVSTNSPLYPNASEGNGMYVGVVDGSTPYGDVVKWGLTNLFDAPPTVAPDPNRHILTTDVTSPTAFVSEFFNSTSLPLGHGFNQTNTGNLAACYAFTPMTNIPVKMIVLDDTCKSNKLAQYPTFYGGGWIDAERYNWLTNELQKGQDADQLMIIAAHVPVCPQTNLYDTNLSLDFYSGQIETNLLATLHSYPNLILLMAGHRHMSVVTAQPSPDPAQPEYGFWEVETPSLRDFPRQFRTWEILRNSDNTISILTTDVDPVVETNTPAWKSLAYTIGADHLFGRLPLTDASSHTYNAELVKPLTARMRAKMAGVGGKIGHRVAIRQDSTGAVIDFMGKLESADAVSGPWKEVQGAACQYAPSETGKTTFYRAVEP